MDVEAGSGSTMIVSRSKEDIYDSDADAEELQSSPARQFEAMTETNGWYPFRRP